MRKDAMKTQIRLALVLVLATVPLRTQGAESDPAMLTKLENCAACHGANGISTADGIPNLAGQKANYLRSQLTAFKNGTRKNDIMSVIAPQLSDGEMQALAAYFASRQGAANGEARSETPPQVAMGKVSIPDDYRSRFTAYRTTDFPAPRNQVRYNYANETALAAARAGKPLPDGSQIVVATFSAALGSDGNPIKGPDGHFMPKDPVNFTAMAREAGWGDAVPALIRDENWNFGTFKADRTANAGSQATCLGCHRGQASVSYLFSQKELIEAAQKTK
jgi:cytochrome c553